MAVTVDIPVILRKATGDQATITAEGDDILSVIENIDQQFPGFQSKLIDDGGKIRRFVNVYLNDEDIRYREGPKTRVQDGDRISIIPALAGG